MHAVRVITLIIALLVQAMPVALMAHGSATPGCEMSCCAWMQKAGLDDCGCVEAPVDNTSPAPASTPPASGRDLLAQPHWVALCEELFLFKNPTPASPPPSAIQHEQRVSTQPHVRLPVLFCSFLT